MTSLLEYLHTYTHTKIMVKHTLTLIMNQAGSPKSIKLSTAQSTSEVRSTLDELAETGIADAIDTN